MSLKKLATITLNINDFMTNDIRPALEAGFVEAVDVDAHFLNCVR